MQMNQLKKSKFIKFLEKIGVYRQDSLIEIKENITQDISFTKGKIADFSRAKESESAKEVYYYYKKLLFLLKARKRVKVAIEKSNAFYGIHSYIYNYSDLKELGEVLKVINKGKTHKTFKQFFTTLNTSIKQEGNQATNVDELLNAVAIFKKRYQGKLTNKNKKAFIFIPNFKYSYEDSQKDLRVNKKLLNSNLNVQTT